MPERKEMKLDNPHTTLHANDSDDVDTAQQSIMESEYRTKEPDFVPYEAVALKEKMVVVDQSIDKIMSIINRT